MLHCCALRGTRQSPAASAHCRAVLVCHQARFALLPLLRSGARPYDRQRPAPGAGMSLPKRLTARACAAAFVMAVTAAVGSSPGLSRPAVTFCRPRVTHVADGGCRLMFLVLLTLCVRSRTGAGGARHRGGHARQGTPASSTSLPTAPVPQLQYHGHESRPSPSAGALSCFWCFWRPVGAAVAARAVPATAEVAHATALTPLRSLPRGCAPSWSETGQVLDYVCPPESPKSQQQ